MSKIVILVNAKWREFCEDYPELLESGEAESKAAVSQEELEDKDDESKSSRRSLRSGRKVAKAGSSKGHNGSNASTPKTGKRKTTCSVRNAYYQRINQISLQYPLISRKQMQRPIETPMLNLNKC